MKDFKIPEFMKPNQEPTRFSDMVDAYEKKFGKTWCGEYYSYTDEEMCEIFEKCLKENRTFFDVVGDTPTQTDEDEDI